MNFAIAVKILFAIGRMLNLLVELRLRPRNRIRNCADARIEVDHRHDARADQSGQYADESRPEDPTQVEVPIARSGIADGVKRKKGCKQKVDTVAASSSCLKDLA